MVAPVFFKIANEPPHPIIQCFHLSSSKAAYRPTLYIN